GVKPYYYFIQRCYSSLIKKLSKVLSPLSVAFLITLGLRPCPVHVLRSPSTQYSYLAGRLLRGVLARFLGSVSSISSLISIPSAAICSMYSLTFCSRSRAAACSASLISRC